MATFYVVQSWQRALPLVARWNGKMTRLKKF